MAEFMTIAELADYLGVPVRTLRRWRHEGRAPVGYRLNGSVRFKRQDIERWLEQQRDPEREPAA